MSKSHKTAVVIIPPESCWKPIQDIRSKHDKAYKRWMPHINLLYPFIEDSGLTLNREACTMTQGLQNIRPFTVKLTTVGYFTHGRNSTFWVQPDSGGTTPQKQKVTKEPKLKKKLPSLKSKVATRKESLGQEAYKPQGQPIIDTSTQSQPVNTGSRDYLFTNPLPYGNSVTPSLDNLKEAIWRPGDELLRSHAGHVTSGLDALQFAVWQPGDSDNTIKKVSFSPKQGKKQGQSKSENKDLNQNQKNCTIARQLYQCESNASSMTAYGIINDDLDDDDEDEDDQSDDYDSESSSSSDEEAEDPRSDDGLQCTKLLQHKLQSLYPFYDDLVRISHNSGYQPCSEVDTGYQPHLTLGQCPTGETKKMVRDCQKVFSDSPQGGPIEFTVDQVHIITREGDRPFTIKASVPLQG